MSEDQAGNAKLIRVSNLYGFHGLSQLQRLMSEHEAACQQEAHFSPTDPQLQRLMSEAERDMQAYCQQAFAPRVPDVTGEGCADRSAPGAVSDIYIRTSSEIAVTQEMIAAGVQELLVAQGCVISESYWAEKIYRAMAALAPITSEPTDADVESLAICLLAGLRDCSFTEAKSQFEAHHRVRMLRAARAAFDHPGYLPSIKAARQDVANHRKALVSAPPQPDFRAERDNLLEVAIDQATQINALEGEKAALIAKDNLQHEFNISLADKNISKDAKIAALEAERNAAFATLETARLKEDGGLAPVVVIGLDTADGPDRAYEQAWVRAESLWEETKRAASLEIERDTLKAQLAAFTAADPQPAVPDPPIRRPDGTPAPQPRPWSPPKHGGDPRRIGG